MKDRTEKPLYEQYCEDVLNGKIVTCLYIKQAVQRFIAFRERDDMYFDPDAVEQCTKFISILKHYKGKTAGESFRLTPWQSFFIACVVGLKWKKDHTRVCREVYLQMARKQGKSTLIAALSLYFLIADGEAAPEVACLATSRDQAGLIFEMITEFSKSLDPAGTEIKKYRNYIKVPACKGQCKVFSSDSSRLDGLNISFGIIDEYAALTDDKLYSVIKSSQAMRTQPLIIEITTPQFDLTSPGYAKFQAAIEVLAGIKENDSFFPFLYTLDTDDEWDDPEVWIKSNPNLGITVTKDFIESEVQNAKIQSSQEVPVKIKTIGIWCSSAQSWIPQERVAQCMDKVDLKKFEGAPAWMGIDLGSVSDFCALSVMMKGYGDDSDKFYFKNYSFIPQQTLDTHPDKEKYKEFVREGSMIVTPGNTTDYDYILAKILEINNIVSIQAIAYDVWNSSQWAINATNEGLPLEPYSQAISNFSNPTRELERLILSGEAVIDKSMNFLWQVGHAVIKYDWNNNVKVTKEKYGNKVDNIIAATEALGIYLKQPIETDFTIFKL